MKRIAFMCLATLPLLVQAASCESLMRKYHTPDPASKTIAQLERWVKHRVSSAADAAELKECLIAGAADNPNQASYAGKGGAI